MAPIRLPAATSYGQLSPKAGFRALEPSIKDPRGAFPDASVQWPFAAVSLHHRCGGSAGFRPASQFSALSEGGTSSVFI